MRELKYLKKRLRQKEEAIKKIKRLYPHLKILNDNILIEYLGLESYERLIEFAKELEASDMPKSRDIYTSNKKVCRCCDSEGMPKVLYKYKMDAQRATKFISDRENIKLKIYHCPTSEGWHLSRL